MAVNPCKECGGPVSDKAESCPMCGARQKKKTSVLAWIGLVLLVLAGIGMCTEKTLDKNPSASASTQSNESGAAEPIQNWEYKNSKDEMRGIETKFASTVSANTVNFDFPYNGGSKLIMALRKTGTDTDVMLSISKGQILCDFRNCEVAFKFDNGNVQSITMSRPSDHSSDLLFVAYDKTKHNIINELKTSKKLVVEVQFYREGKKQFTFDVSGLNWD